MRGLLALLVVLAAAGCGGTKTVTVTQTQTVTRTTTVRETTTVSAAAPTAAPCTGSSLDGTFDVVPGSAGAGQIGYDLMLTNTGSGDCWVSGLPAGELLDANGHALPTNIGPAHPGEAAAHALLGHGQAAVAHARFSPDVPGTGDAQTSLCEPKAATLRVVVGGASLDAPVQPPTPVCERGSLTFTNFAPAS